MAMIQFLDQGVNESVKQHYWAGLLRTLVKENDSIMSFWEKRTILDAFIWLVSG
jgi:hypothetical protein